jgi:hypothetical protein
LTNKLGGDAIIDFVSPKNLVIRDLENFYRFSSCNDSVPTYNVYCPVRGDLYQYLVANINTRERISDLGKKNCRYNSRHANSVWS